MIRDLRIFALLILAFSISSSAQSLGDLARQIRAERLKNPVPHAKVITNDDLASTEPEPGVDSEDESKDAAQDAPGVEGAETAKAPGSAEDAKKGTSTETVVEEPKTGKNSNQARKHPAKERETQEREIQQRTQEINGIYLDRIATLRQQFNAAQTELAKLQVAQVESTNNFQRTLGVSPNPSTYTQQQSLFNEQIEVQRNLIHSLNSQLEDAYEAARHAGVPHASD
jgi:hypothetical protein